jgi:hypothetical protein
VFVINHYIGVKLFSHMVGATLGTKETWYWVEFGTNVYLVKQGRIHLIFCSKMIPWLSPIHIWSQGPNIQRCPLPQWKECLGLQCLMMFDRIWLLQLKIDICIQ